jgi:hypothetical protein
MRLFAVLLLTPLLAFGADKKKPKLDLGLKVDVGGDIPKGGELQAPKEKKETVQSSQTATDLTYSIVRVQHGKSFNRGPNGAVATAALDAIPASGNPLTTEKFTTVVRVKCPQKRTAPIELSITDSRALTMMEGSGMVYFRGEKQDESDYTIDWDPTPFKAAGEYKLHIKVAGNEIATLPFRVVEKK